MLRYIGFLLFSFILTISTLSQSSLWGGRKDFNIRQKLYKLENNSWYKLGDDSAKEKIYHSG